MNFLHVHFKDKFSQCSLITFFTFELVLVMSLSIVVVKLYFGVSCEGTVITEQFGSVFPFLLVIAVFFPHMKMEQRIPGGAEVTLMTFKRFFLMFVVYTEE